MSHELEINANGTANMVWANTPCWHGLGTEMDPDAGALVWMKAAGLDWDVVKQPMFTELPNGEKITVTGKNGGEYSVLVRDHRNKKFDQKDIFGPVGPEWTEVQNNEVFTFMEKWCKAGNMKMETCGALKGGTEIWALAKYADEFELIKGDTAKGYMLIHSAHVWGKGNSIRNSLTRVVCNNTLQIALGSSNGAFRMPHVRAFDADVQKRAEEAIGLVTEQNKQMKEAISYLASKKAPDNAMEEYIVKLYQPKAANDEKVQLNQTSEIVWDAIHLAPGSALNSSKGTWWGALNGVTYYEDHMRMSYVDQTNVLGSALLGAGSRKKTQAFELAMEYARVA